MSVYKPKGRKEYVYDFWIEGYRFHGNTERSEKREALKVEEEEKEAARKQVSAVGNTKPAAPLTLDTTIGRYWLEWGQHQKNAAALKRDFTRIISFHGKDKLLSDLTDDDVAKLVAWRRGHRVIRRYKNPNDKRAKAAPLITPAQVNRSTVQMLRRLFVRAGRNGKSAMTPSRTGRNISCLNPKSAYASCAPTRMRRLKSKWTLNMKCCAASRWRAAFGAMKACCVGRRSI
jgi:hypothetical protein